MRLGYPDAVKLNQVEGVKENASVIALPLARDPSAWYIVCCISSFVLAEGDRAHRTEQAISVGGDMPCNLSKTAAQIVGESLALYRIIIGACASVARPARLAFSRKQRKTMCA
jgi:hypothetical protein